MEPTVLAGPVEFSPAEIALIVAVLAAIFVALTLPGWAVLSFAAYRRRKAQRPGPAWGSAVAGAVAGIVVCAAVAALTGSVVYGLGVGRRGGRRRGRLGHLLGDRVLARSAGHHPGGRQHRTGGARPAGPAGE